MLRKLVLGLVTVASLCAIGLAPTEASAKASGGRGLGRGIGGHHFAGGHGFGGRHFGGGLATGFGFALVDAAIAASACRTVVTTNGRVVNVC